ncbi:MAG: hypothetical protein ACKV0T_00875 [Planctomycetales bacterium]
MATLLGAFLFFAYHHAKVISALSGIFALVGFLAWVAHLRQNQGVDGYLTQWLERIDWVPEAMAAEEEYSLTKVSIGPDS